MDTQGDAFFFAFPTAPGAVAAASAMTEALASGPIRVRAGLHTGTPLLAEEGYVGDDVHRAARIAAAGHGGQVLVSAATASLVDARAHRPRRASLQGPRRPQSASTSSETRRSRHSSRCIGRTSRCRRRRSSAASASWPRSAALLRDGARLVTLTGPGGTGKTRLAIQSAAEAADSFPDGIWWVPLSSLRDAHLLVSSIAQALAVEEEPGRDLADSVAARLAGKAGAADPRQRRASHARDRDRDRGAPRHRRPDAPRHEPRAPPAPGRARVLGAVTRGRGRCRALPHAGAGAGLRGRGVRGRRRALLAAGQPAARARARGRSHRRVLAGAARRAAVPAPRSAEGGP